MIKECLWNGLLKSKFDVLNTVPENIHTSRFASMDEYQRAYAIAIGMLQNLQMWSKEGKVPTDRRELEKMIDGMIAKRSFDDAYGQLKSKYDVFKTASDGQLLKQCQEAISTLKQCGGEFESSADAYEYMMLKL
jgi:hypothetical protein